MEDTNKIPVECYLVNKTSKDGKNYTCLYLPAIDKNVFLEKAEVLLIKLLSTRK